MRNAEIFLSNSFFASSNAVLIASL